jgi:hypothetical protein
LLQCDEHNWAVDWGQIKLTSIDELQYYSRQAIYEIFMTHRSKRNLATVAETKEGS